ncbi:glycoside hydrolase family 3 C-terminal domain-containing protein [Actinomadura rayongensis]|nr:glycoside hydrolase family 3 C-terminal domain-containing protein [Actinomadura rayongensis]
MVAGELAGTQETGVIATVKHYAGNYQETGRFTINTVIDERALREGELLAFEIAVERSGVGAVMCSYNRLNGPYASESRYLLTDVLKDEWGFQGWVMSDWGAAHSTEASANAGLDQEFPLNRWFGAALGRAVADGRVPTARLDDMARRIVRTMARVGLLDASPVPDFDAAESYRVSQRIAENGIVLLANERGLLPLDPAAEHRVLVVGAHADVGVPSGGGSCAVDPIGGNAVPVDLPPGQLPVMQPIWVPSSPLEAIREEFPRAAVSFADGSDVDAATGAARDADVVVVFADQWTCEHYDVEDLSLPREQDRLIDALAAVNDSVVVVLQTGGPVLTPWAGRVGAVLEAWYPGHRGGPAIAWVLSGAVNPSGKLPVTFPFSADDLPTSIVPTSQPIEMTGMADPAVDWSPATAFDVSYDHALTSGYKWFTGDRRPAFPFGFGRSYTTFEIGGLSVDPENLTAWADVRNTGDRAGAEVVQLYAQLPDTLGPCPRRLVGWAKVHLAPGESTRARIDLERRLLAVWDTASRGWRRPAGQAVFDVGSSSAHVADSARASL